MTLGRPRHTAARRLDLNPPRPNAENDGMIYRASRRPLEREGMLGVVFPSDVVRRVFDRVVRLGIAAGNLSVAACVAMLLGGVCGGRVVITDSIPRGLYWRAPGTVARDAVVGGCLPERIALAIARDGVENRGPCDGGTLPFFKIVAAVGGDVVDEDASGISVNGVAWPWSAPRANDSDGRALPHRDGRFVVPADDVLLLGVNPFSYDGRYFGPTPLRYVSRYRPIAVESTTYAERFWQLQRGNAS